MPQVEITEAEFEMLSLWREQQKDERKRRLQYGPSLDQPVKTESKKTVLGDLLPSRQEMARSLSLADTAKRLGIDLPWLSPKAHAARQRMQRTRIEDDEVVCSKHGSEDMRHYVRKGKTYVRCYVCKREHQRRYNGEYRRKMKYRIRPCPRCGTAGFFTGVYCKPCHAAYEKERRARHARQGS